jgi:hypothetical protein
MERTPSLFASAHFEVKELPQVVTQGGNKHGILPPRAVPGTPKTIDAPIWLALHNKVALKLPPMVWSREALPSYLYGVHAQVEIGPEGPRASHPARNPIRLNFVPQAARGGPTVSPSPVEFRSLHRSSLFL